jgi:hypothetical protein
LSPTARHRFDVNIAQYRRQLDYEYQEKLITQLEKSRNELHIPRIEKLIWDYERARKNGIMTPAAFMLVWSSLHPDSRKSISEGKLADAFRAFERIREFVLSEADNPVRDKLPKTVAELLRRRKNKT